MTVFQRSFLRSKDHLVQVPFSYLQDTSAFNARRGRASSHNHGCLHYLELTRELSFVQKRRSGHWDCSVVQGGAEAKADRHVHGAAIAARCRACNSAHATKAKLCSSTLVGMGKSAGKD